MRWLRLFSLVLGLLGATSARAADFSITITNTSSLDWSEGLLTLQPLIQLGTRPQPGTPEYSTYQFVTSANGNDSSCSPQYAGDIGHLLAGWPSLVLGTNAWLVPGLDGGDATTVAITASPGQQLYYIAWVTVAKDDFVAMSRVGDYRDLAIPLFDDQGAPLSRVLFDIRGYDVDSLDQWDGTWAGPQDDPDDGSCEPRCATGSPWSQTCYVTHGAGYYASSNGDPPPQPGIMRDAWVWDSAAAFPGYQFTTDGIAVGDVNSTNGTTNDLVVVLESARYYDFPPYSGTGKAVVLSRDGALVSRFDDPTAGRDFMGLPLVENLNSSTRREYLVGEFVSELKSGKVYALNGSGNPSTVVSEWGAPSGPYGWPGLWNMGPTAGDVRSNLSGNEVVVGDWNGNVVVLNRTSGAVRDRYNAFTAHGENLYGHVAVGNVNGSTGNEIVVFGGATGQVIVLGVDSNCTSYPCTLTEHWVSGSLPGGYAFGSGPAIGNLDSQSRSEIVVAATGTTPTVYAFDMGWTSDDPTKCKYKWTLPGGAGSDYYWTSPVIGNVDGSTGNEVVVFSSSNSVLSVLKAPTASTGHCVEGTVLWSHTVGSGGPAWFTPALANLGGSSALDVVVASYQTLEVVDVAARSVLYTFADRDASFFPSAVIEPVGSGSSRARIYVSGWINGKVYGLTVPTTSTPTGWLTFMGDNTRAGAR
jgi:hypothetical protein